ncbi:MAG: tetratricopeptide repeat protein, partial [Chitinophagaceae bacterium]
MISFSQNSRHENEVYRRLYNAADKYYHDAENNNISEDKQEQLNHDALTAFRNLVMKMETEKNVNDSLAFHSYFKIGILEHFFNNLPAAEKAYRHSIQLKQTLTQLPDSFLFKPQLYLGIVLYNENQFDSAVAAYKKAEVIAEAYSTPLQETERLYNTLGALYYETGNYRQAKNYLEKSVALLPKNHPYYKDLLVNYKINLASTLTKLEEYDEADKIYQSIFHFNILRDIILHNTGVINLNLGSIHKALQNFYQVNPAKTNSARLYNDMALAHYNLGHNDSARYYLDKASAQVRMDLSGKKTISYGQTLKIRGDLLLSEKKTADAILSYQQAIVQFYADFNEIIPAKNPVEYTGVFSYINLFNTLTAKADAYEQLNKVDKKISSLKSALDAYRSAFKLADYVERTYDSDEARLFLNKIKYVVHNRPISLCILLYDLTGEKEFLEEAYLFDQRNKGSVLAFSIHENEIKSKLGIGDLLSRQENSLKSAITRLSLKSAQVTDNKQLQELNSSIRDFEIQLGRIQEKINNTPGYEKMRSADRVPSVTDLQQKLLDNNTSLLSYHLTKTELLIICISKKEISYKKVPLKDSFFSALQSFVTSLHQVNSDIKYDAAGISQKLYAWLIQPVYEKISYANRLIIIPDDELNYVPFEALQNNEKKYLVESFAIQYQYSTSLLKTAEIKLASNKNIAFAPFFDSGYSLQNIVFSKL